jgi:hypothetical protein
MKETADITVRVGFKRNPKDVFDEIEFASARMIRDGWTVCDSIIEESLGNVHIIFERELTVPCHEGYNNELKYL